jgi:3-isopropylmalate/(R)-2-methylmalate dehydratase small subunit
MKSQFIQISSTCVPFPAANIDTDQIYPARYLKATTKNDMAEKLFKDLRYDRDTGEPNPDFVLNDPTYSGEILVAGKNFGSGSSREHAAWALKDYGFNAVVSSFFADIFNNNALNNNLLTVTVEEDFLQQLLKQIKTNPKTIVEIDLTAQTITVPDLDLTQTFPINPYKKMCLLENYDDISYLLSLKDKLKEFENQRQNDFSYVK